MSIERKNITLLKIGIIGAGRLGRTLAWCLDAHGLDIHATASPMGDEVRAFAAKTKRSMVLSAQAVVDSCDLVFVTPSTTASRRPLNC